MDSAQLHLASSSPRRRSILRSLGIEFTQAGVCVDESHRPHEIITDIPMRLAMKKVRAVERKDSCQLPILAADTLVIIGDQLCGKPKSKDDALSMLSKLSGRSHLVVTAVVLQVGEQIFSSKSSTEVRFRHISDEEAKAYWRSGEPTGKAGAYAIQGIGGVFVESIRGSYSGVVGLPVFETATLLINAGIQILHHQKL